MTVHLDPSVGDTSTDTPVGAAAELRTTDAIRSRAHGLLDRARAGDSAWFSIDDDALLLAADDVVAVTRRRYPDLDIPFHSRWRHFEAGGLDRISGAADQLPTEVDERARALIDLAVVSVLLDAGAGPDWAFREPGTELSLARSEGLGVASWHAFLDGRFSAGRTPMVDATGLRDLTVESLATAFQVTGSNPLVGLSGRVELLHRLADALIARPDVFGPDGRPGRLYDALVDDGDRSIPATDILSALLTTLSRIWLSDNSIGDQPVGDCWRHQAVHGAGRTEGWMPFHKLSQWLTYSLLEPFAWAGVEVSGLDDLTALPEYRNGGLLIDTGAIRLHDPALVERTWSVGDELIVEWRALTIALIDELAPLVRERLDVEQSALPLACVLEGGTWSAGRALAQRLRGGLPPLAIASDGTVF
ncbi:URC4/urg3 family protein [Gordonia insulae]|uniref:Uracil phosphoribosyltransferase n=1 Tax=Gordonia insulae TaxID=2420509 RepID=A0A3G8JJA9_9ACTN|nr:URC4/urg3 family protein [Gordonia insulae]AZG44612.1 hypothetical protein D7316_01198 [Gordonia insulae]